MDFSHRNNLRYCRQKIVEDLDVLDIIDNLIENEIVDDETQERIMSERTRRDRVRALLDSLPSRGPRAYKVFLAALETDYAWLAEVIQTKQQSDITDFNETSHLNDILLKGGVPHPPSFNISRVNELEAIKQGLSELSPGQFLTLHGMPGSGKSVLAAESVRDPAVTLNNFPGGVFWFKVGMVDTDQLLNKLRALCTKLDAPALPTSIEEAQEVLRKLFLSRHLSDSLLILDDVWRPEVIKTFTLPVRILVTTQDISVMETVRGHFSVVEIRSGFTETESLELFSSYVKIPADYLPVEARAIHEECKGSPMVISLIGSLISESGRCRQTQRQSGRWQYYLQSLKTRRYSKFKKQLSYEHESVMGAVQMSVDNLDEADKDKYEKLAVFLDDDPIPIKTLEILWKVDKYEVEDTMNNFLKKCLVSCEADSTKDSLVYTLHDLQLDYLKNKLRDDPDKEKTLHKDFVEEYLRLAEGQYEKMTCDGYIFSHLGYHLQMGGLTPLFPDIYLNLGYVEANLKATGPVDILSDYRKYKMFISGEDFEHEEALQDFEDFCRTAGAKMQGNNDTDIVQLGLMEEQESHVYLAAQRMADMRPETLYLEWRNRSSVSSHNIATMNHPGSGARVVKFLMDERLVTGGGDGNIYVWNVGSGEVLQKLNCHSSEVAALDTDMSDVDLICSLSEEGYLRQWRLRPLEDAHNTSGERLSSGQTNSLRRRSVKRSYKYSSNMSLDEMFFRPNSRAEALSSFLTTESEGDSVKAISWRPGSQEVAVAGSEGNIRIFDLESGMIVSSLEKCHTDIINDLAYSANGLLLASASDDCTVRMWTASGQFHSSLNVHEMRVTHVRWLGQRDSLVSLSSDSLYMWHKPGSEHLHTALLKRNRTSSWTCVAASERSVAAGTAEDKLVLVWSVDTCQVIAALPGQTSPVACLDFSHDGLYLASTSEETLMVWSMCDIEEGGQAGGQQPLSLGPPHMTRWRDREAVTAAPDDMNRMVVLREGVVTNTSPVETSHITCLMLSRDLRRVVFGTADGWVKEYRCEQEEVTNLVRHGGPVTSVVISDFANIVVSGSAVSSQGLKINNLDTGACVSCDELRDTRSSGVRDVRIIHMGNKVLSCTLGGKLHVWNIHSGKLELSVMSGTTEHATCLDVAERDGDTVAAVSGVKGGVKIVDLRTGQRLVEVGPASAPVRVVRFSPNGRLIVTGHDTGTVQIWDAVSGASISSPLSLHSSWVTDISISSDCSTLLTAGDRLVWWSLPAPPPATPSHHQPMRRKLSLPIPRSRRSSGSSPLSCSPIETFRRQGSGHFDTLSLPSSPVGKRKLTKTGSGGQKELLQTFDIKGSSVNKVWVNKDFTQFVAVDDAGICYILDEYIPKSFSSP